MQVIVKGNKSVHTCCPATLHACKWTLTVAMTFPGRESNISNIAAGCALRMEK
jgi:hypothetical protein